ncbi:aminotransferase class V-fold PLP-dependent enzyme [Paenibacillus sp. y28]|uniref:aminotransferase class V-fold PLP-dependent enzyme n=1 Tax=Paenibacillus sp. y28 TaxID=3129110 RepID=UPI0030168AFA
MSKVIYFDNAASSWPKPGAVSEAMMRSLEDAAANPGRGSHQMAVQASRVLFEARKNLAKLFGVKNPNDISFALNTTMALNQAIKGFVKPGQHVVSTSLEHNSVRRPLEFLKETRGVEVSYVSSQEDGTIDWNELVSVVRPDTSLLVLSHGSNLLGSIFPIQYIAKLKKSFPQLKVLVDAAQTAGTLPIHVEQMEIDMLAFPGHKGLLGPQGTGGLYIHPELELEPVFHGGTGSQSEAIGQPNVRPDKYESGTQNTVGIAGLNAGVKFVLEQKLEAIHQKEWAFTQKIMEALQGINRLHLLGPKLGENRTGIVSFYHEGVDASEMAFILDQSFQIAVRSGYHCTPLAHEVAKTVGKGAVRASVGYFTTEEEVDTLIDAVTQICRHYES